MSYLGAYAAVGVVLLIGIGVFVGAITANRMLAPVAPNPAKLATYECGLDPLDTDWAQTQIRYYVFAYLYVVFAVDAVYLFPWATLFAEDAYGLVTLVEMAVFIGVLAVGIAYAWRRGVLAWDRSWDAATRAPAAVAGTTLRRVEEPV